MNCAFAYCIFLFIILDSHSYCMGVTFSFLLHSWYLERFHQTHVRSVKVISSIIGFTKFNLKLSAMNVSVGRPVNDLYKENFVL